MPPLAQGWETPPRPASVDIAEDLGQRVNRSRLQRIEVATGTGKEMERNGKNDRYDPDSDD